MHFFGVVFHLVYLIYVLKTFKYERGKKWGRILEGQHRIATGAAAHTLFRLGHQRTAEDNFIHPALPRSFAASLCRDDSTTFKV